MKFALWLMILAISVWTLDRDDWMSAAYGNYVQVSKVGTNTRTVTAANGSVITEVFPIYATQTVISTLTGTFTDGGPSTNTQSGSVTDTNCHTGGSQYGGGQWNLCNRTDPSQQKNTQEDNQKNNDNGANQSTALGMAAIAAGMAMVAAGMALLPNPPTTPIGVALIAAGMALIAAGMAALAAASKMNKNADKSGVLGNNLDNLDPYKSTISPSSTAPGTSTLGDGNSSGIKIDPALARTGKMDGIFGDMEKKTGLNRDDFMKAMAAGGDPLALLAASPALAGKPSGSEANLKKMMDDTIAKGNLPSGQEVMDKLGLSKDDLGSSGGGVDPNRNIASAAPNVDSLFPSREEKISSAGGDNNFKLSSEVQAALDKNGITGRNIFDMVHAQYVKKTPLMFGVQPSKDGTTPNPYTNLNGADKVDL